MREAGMTAGLASSLGIVAGLLVVITALLRWMLARPLARLVGAFGALKEGDLTTRIEVRSRDELGELARHFNGLRRTCRERSSGYRPTRGPCRDQLARCLRYRTGLQPAPARRRSVRAPSPPRWRK